MERLEKLLKECVYAYAKSLIATPGVTHEIFRTDTRWRFLFPLMSRSSVSIAEFRAEILQGDHRRITQLVDEEICNVLLTIDELGGWIASQ